VLDVPLGGRVDDVLPMIPLLLLAAALGAPPAVSVDTSAMVGGGLAEEDARQLRRALLVRLVEEGYVVAPSEGSVQIWLTVRPASSGWSVEARAAHVYSYHVKSSALSVLSLEILQRATMALDGAREDLAARIEGATSNAASSSSSLSSDSVVDGVETPGKRTSGSTWFVGAGASAGILARSGGVDPIVQARFDLRAPPRIGGRVQAGIDWSNGSGPLSILEWLAQIGPTWSPRLNPSLTFTTGLLGGILVHQFRYDPQDSGSRIDWTFAAPAELSYRIGWATLGGALIAGISERPRDHVISGNLAWHRGSYYVGVSAGLGVVL
jgi:hypothetical protein